MTKRSSGDGAQLRAHGSTRRDFLAATSRVMAGTILGARALRAGTRVHLPAHADVVPETFVHTVTMSPGDLERLATEGVDAAKRAGASYADIRIAERHTLIVYEIRQVVLTTSLTYGVRALVDGTWGFAYGRVPTVDGVAQIANEATTNARIAAQLSSPFGSTAAAFPDWCPPPVATGEWSIPIRIDPFTVPVEQHCETVESLSATLDRVPEVGAIRVVIVPTWVRETRVLAATTGTLVRQSLPRALVETRLSTEIGSNRITVPIAGLESSSAGFELLLAPELPDRLQRSGDEIVRLARLPQGAMQVGRYPVVFDGTMMGEFMSTILGRSLELDRAVNQDIDQYGSSLFAPELLGAPVASPLLTITGSRAVPSVTAVHWDDEGAVARDHTVLQDGVLVDYHTDGETVGALTSWYRRHARPLQGNGCATAPDARDAVSIRLPHLIMQPNPSRSSLDELCAEMQHGVVALNQSLISTDNRLLSGHIDSYNGLFEVSRGVITRRLKGNALHFTTKKLLKGLTAVGDATTVQRSDRLTWKGTPWAAAQHDTSAPAALFREIDVVGNQ